MLPDNTICTSNSNKESTPPCPIFLGLPGLCAEHCGQSITLQSYINTEYRAVQEHGYTFTLEYSVVGVHNLPPRSHEHFLLSPQAVRDISGSAVSVSLSLSLQCHSVHGSHEMASAAGSCHHTKWPPLLHCTQGPRTGNAAVQAKCPVL